MNNKDQNRTELSALLDGEIRDVGQVEQLGARLKDDTDLAAEFEEQRQVKSLLASLPDYEAPDFLATRVMGEIAEGRKKRRPAALLRNLGLVATGFVLCLALVVAVAQYNVNQAAPGEQDLARSAQPSDLSDLPVLSLDQGRAYFASDSDQRSMVRPMLLPGDMDWHSAPQADGVDDERIKEFLEFAMKAHSYRICETTSEDYAPDMTEAILLLDEGRGR